MKQISKEQKSNLARLLATENLNIEHRKVKTAYFIPKTRTLCLPIWEDMSNDLYDLLCGHEVGHALYTPEKGIEDFHAKCGDIPFDVCNIVEDIRIERMIQDTYPGLPRVFRKAYSELVEDDFFGTKEKNIPECGFLDRLNLRGKVGSLLDIPLDADEEVIYQKCLKAQTFDDVLDICLEIKDMIEKEPPQNQSEDDDSSEEADDSNPLPSDQDQDDDTETDGSDSDGSEETDDGSEADGGEETDDDGDEGMPDVDASSSDISSENDNDETETSAAASDDGASESVPEELVADTLKDFEDKLEQIVEDQDERQYTPVMLPRPNYIYDSIIKYDMLRKDRGTQIFGEDSAIELDVNTRYTNFRKATNKKVGTLVREFEQRKAAYQYSRATESRTGKLDVNKLHNYKLTDELFLSQTKLADSKSHGMIFLLDYSGSMAGVLKDVIDQTLNLVTFCKKVGIPFRVYSFTNTWATKSPTTIEATFNEVDLSDVILVEHITSEMSKTKYEEAFKALWMTQNTHWRGGKYDQLGGTPLDTVLTMMPTILTDFAKKNGIQKTTFVTLTDGDSSNMNTTHGWNEMTSKMEIKCGGKTHTIARYRSTNSLMEMISDLPGISTIGFFLPNHKKELNRLLNRFHTHTAHVKKARKLHNKNGFSSVKNRGYGAYYILDSDVGITDNEFVTSIDEDAANSRKAQNKLAKQFGAHNQKARQTRVLLTSLAEKIA